MKQDGYLENLAEDGDVVIEPRGGWRLTVLEDGGCALEFLDTHLVVRLPGPNAPDDLIAAVAEARSREAETEIDDAGLWPGALDAAAEPEAT